MKNILVLAHDDAGQEARFQAALSLLRLRDVKSLDTLLALVGDGPLEIARQAEDVLFTLAGEGQPGNTNLDEKQQSRRQARDAWEKWWDANRGKVAKDNRVSQAAFCVCCSKRRARCSAVPQWCATVLSTSRS